MATIEQLREQAGTCPRCRGSHVVVILYGLPPDDFAEVGVELGGCVVSSDDPAWRCGDCGHGWGRARP